MVYHPALSDIKSVKEGSLRELKTIEESSKRDARAAMLTRIALARYPPQRVGVSIRGYPDDHSQPPTALVVDRVRVQTFSLIVLIIGISAFTADNNIAAQTVQLPPPAASSLDRIAQASPYGYPLSPPPPAWDPYGPQASQIYPVPATNPGTNPPPTWATSAVNGQPGYPGYSTAPPPIVPSNPSQPLPVGYPQPPTQQSQWFQQTYQQSLRAYQGVRGSWTYVLGTGRGNSVAVNELDTSATFALPFFMNSPANINQAPLLITPGFGLQLWGGPESNVFPTTNTLAPQLPGNTYDSFIDTAWNPQFTPLFGAEFGIRVGFYTNWDVFVTDSWRVMGRAIGTLNMTPTFQGKLGVIYLDRNQVKLLPAVGFTWTPNATSRYDVFFPAPRAMWRFGQTRRHAWWGYVAGEYGGGRWTFRTVNANQTNGFVQNFDYNDIRISLGTEWVPLATTGFSGNFEIGYAFYRQLFFVNDLGPQRFQQIYDLPSTIMFRLGLAY